MSRSDRQRTGLLLLGFVLADVLLGAFAQNATFMSTGQVFFWPAMGRASDRP